MNQIGSVIDAEEALRAYAATADAIERGDTSFYDEIGALGPQLLAEFSEAEMARRDTEERWLKDLRQYKGIYDPEIEKLIGPNRSKAFVRSTRVKVKTVDARVADLLFPSNSERNWTAEPTPMPSIDEETEQNLFASLRETLQREPTSAEFDAAVNKLAKEAAARMTKVIDDQLTDARYRETARKVLHSGHVYGTGVLKAPLVERKVRTKFVLEGGKWVRKTLSYVVPFVEYVPLWRFYPDMCATELKDCRYVFERHMMTRAALSELAKKRSFRAQVIKDYILANPLGAQTHFRNADTEIRDMGARSGARTKDDGQYEVLERWGWLDGEVLAQAGVDVPPERMHETFFSNVWLLPNGEIIKIALEPINGVTWPYHVYYADKDETSIFGDGFPAIMRDDQTMINAATRMVLDNAALTAGPQIEANMSLLASSERAEDIYPFKIWARNGSSPEHPALRVLNIPNGLEELLPLVDMFQRNSDDVTAIPRYMQGENATQGAAGTASGMSMLMANASIVMKDLITNFDEGVTRSFIEAMYMWNMQFNPDNACKGDFDIKARGTASLMAKEVRAQQLNQFASTIAPEDAPYVKREELLRQRAEAHDLASVVKTEEEVLAEQNNEAAQQQAQMAQQMQQLQMQMQQLQAQKMQSEIDKITADIERIKAIATKTNVDAAYAGMQAGGVATERPQIAPAGDAILKSAGFVDKTPQEETPQTQQVQAPTKASGAMTVNQSVPALSTAQRDPIGGQVGANVGEHAGIETAEIEG